MMYKKHLIILFLFLISGCFVPDAPAALHYIFIQKTNKSATETRTGHSTLGHVVDIVPFTSQYTPTAGELEIYHVIVVDIDNDKKSELLKLDKNNRRINTIDFKTFTNKNQKATITVTELDSKTTVIGTFAP